MVINIDCPKEYSEREARLLRKVILQEYEIAYNAIKLERTTKVLSDFVQIAAKSAGTIVQTIPVNNELIEDNAEYNALKRITHEFESSFPGVRVSLELDS
jgi:hypothetical protein